MNKTEHLTLIRQLIAKDDLDTVIQQLQLLLKNHPKLDEAILQSARFEDIKRQIRLGLVDHQSANLTKNQIRAGLLDVLKAIEAQEDTPLLKDKSAPVLSQAKVMQWAEKIYNIENIDKANFS